MQKHILHIVIITICFLWTIQSYGQSALDDAYLLPDDSRNRDFFMVPEFGLWFGTYTNVEAAPQVGYYITDRWAIGGGPHYIYYKFNDYRIAATTGTHIYGIKGFSRFSVIRNAAEMLPFYLFDELFAHIEFEKMNMDGTYFNFPGITEPRIWMNYFYVGGGFMQNISGRTSYFIMLLWNLNDSYFSLYRNPTYRVGVNILF